MANGEVSDDEVEAYHDQRDKILFDGSGSESDFLSSDGEQEVFAHSLSGESDLDEDDMEEAL